MESEKLNFIEESGLLFEGFGMTRMAGRVFGYMLVSDKDEVSFNDIMEVLNASKGSISNTTRQLINTALVEQVSLPGDRKTYYRITKIPAGSILKARTELFTKFAKTLSKGRELKNRKDDMHDWLLEISTFYNWIGDQIDEIIDRWERNKTGIIKEMNNQNKKK
jgi:DNA-binding transcriptional regulator GbsR (MarR family)